jgi:RsiW-degrading membrane proteinase PrsW (M82 family)
MDYIAIAAAPGIAICIYIFYRDIYNKEPKLNLVISFLLGALAILPAIELERYFSKGLLDGSIRSVAIFSFLVVGLSEEVCKFAGLRFFAYNKKTFDEPLDGIVYSLMVSMGFATIENIMYVIKFESILGNGLQIGIQRMFLSIPAHATFAVVMGYFIGRAKFEPVRNTSLMIAGILSATFIHGAYDFFLFVNAYATDGKNIAGVGKTLSEFFLLAGAVISLILALVLSRRLIRVHRQTSYRMFNNKNPDQSV